MLSGFQTSQIFKTVRFVLFNNTLFKLRITNYKLRRVQQNSQFSIFNSQLYIINHKNMKNRLFLTTAIVLLSNFLFAQLQKKPLDFSVYDSWKVIRHQQISNDGNFVVYEVNPYLGDGKLVVNNPNKGFSKEFMRGKNAKISPNSNYVVFKIAPEYQKIRKLKLDKVKKNKFPKDSMQIFIFDTQKIISCANIQKYKLPKEKSDWLAYSYKHEDKSKSKKKKKAKKKDKKKVNKNIRLVIFNPIKNLKYTYDNISDFNVSENGKLIGFIQTKKGKQKSSKVCIFDTEKQKMIKIFDAKGIAKKIVLDKIGKQSAFIFSGDTSKVKSYSLYHWQASMKRTVEVVIDTNSLKMPKDWLVSEHGNLWFSDDNSKLYFGVAPRKKAEPKDTIPDDEKVKLDLWSWTDKLLQPEQLVNLEDEKKRNYLSVYHIDNKKIIRLADEYMPYVKILQKGNSNVAFGVSDVDFQKEQSWDNPIRRDYYLVDIKNGDTKLMLEKTNAEVYISPAGKYIFWFDRKLKNWFAQDTKTLKSVNLTSGIKANFYDEDHDRPEDVSSYRFAGWTENDKYFLLYDRYDIWKIDPTANAKPINITDGKGRKNKIQFRYLKLDYDAKFIDINKVQLLNAFGENNKKSGYFSINFNKKESLKELIYEYFSFYTPIKARYKDLYIWRKSSVEVFPNLRYSDTNFKNAKQLSDANPQQKNYNWATVELVKWQTFNGKQAEGLLYKPENFDPKKKYPMVIYFYELKSDELNYHYYPKPSRSIINPLFYASNDYIVFIPNIRYEVGHPGKSAYNYVVSGTEAMIKKGFIDKEKIGIEGQSWGGYQVAYLVTQTDMYKAAIAGAPVSNMTSAYGGIRWKSGMSRMFQYEKTQSRIGATLWEKPGLYIENSPVFFADKIKTPLLIFHNDNDGAVPWYQGIELFVALRRLNKPSWMVNYNGEPHNLRAKSPACKDWSIRMMQFFNHYLKGKPAPEWLIKGIPAIKKGKDLGY